MVQTSQTTLLDHGTEVIILFKRIKNILLKGPQTNQRNEEKWENTKEM